MKYFLKQILGQLIFFLNLIVFYFRNLLFNKKSPVNTILLSIRISFIQLMVLQKDLAFRFKFFSFFFLFFFSSSKILYSCMYF